MITIDEAVNNFQTLINNAIKKGGLDEKTAIIRSSKTINNIHEAVKSKLINKGINSKNIFPPINSSKPELILYGFFKKKSQDICIIPESINKNEEILSKGLLTGKTDKFGKNYTEKIISINVRSQISSLAKNFDTLYERTFAEAYNLHLRCPKMCLGEVYMIAVPEYDSDAFKKKKVKFTDHIGMVEKYITAFNALNNRIDYNKDTYKYEKCCLLIVDFTFKKPKIYNTDDELKKANLLPSDSTVSIKDLTWDNFVNDLLNIHKDRF